MKKSIIRKPGIVRFFESIRKSFREAGGFSDILRISLRFSEVFQSMPEDAVLIGSYTSTIPALWMKYPPTKQKLIFLVESMCEVQDRMLGAIGIQM